VLRGGTSDYNKACGGHILIEALRNPLHLVEAHVVAPAIVKLRGAGRGVVRHRGGVFERATVFQIGRDAGRPEGVIADPGVDAGAGGRAGGSSRGRWPGAGGSR
jgi:hypothetical protein